MPSNHRPSRTKQKRTPRADQPELASLDFAAAYLNLHPRTLRRWVSSGRITGYRVGRLMRVDLREIYALARPIPTAEHVEDTGAARGV